MKHRRHLDSLDQDIRDHIEEETRDNLARGMTPDEARHAALRKFGNPLRVAEDSREVWSVVWLEQLLQDVRFGLRMLRRNPGFGMVVILTLALGIGVNAAVFSVVNAVLLRPLPYPDAERVVAYSEGIDTSKAASFKPGISGADFFEWRAQAKSFEGMAAYQYNDATLASATDAGQVRVASIAGDFWAIAGARASLGRLFEPAEAAGAVVLTHTYFERRFGGDPRVVGKAMTLDGLPVTITGVLSPNFRFLFPKARMDIASGDIEAFVPAPRLERSGGQKMRVSVVAKLKPHVTIDGALTELRLIEARILRAYPDRWFAGIPRMGLWPLQERLVGNVRRALWILQVAGMFVLLIACANIANLLLARGATRRKEIAIRAAIGAGGARVMRQFLAEGMVLALFGGAAGLLVARGAIAMMARFGAQAVPRLAETAIDGRVLAFTAAVSLATGILFGFGPAISLTGLQGALKDGALGSAGLRIRRVLVAAELALAIVLLTGAGLMVKSFWRMYASPPGFAPENTLVMKVSLSGPEYSGKPRQLAYVEELARRIESTPGVQAAGVAKTSLYLLQSNSATPAPVDQFLESLVSAGYFSAIGMRLVKGRWITGADPPDDVLINETMARRVFGSDDPIGHRIRIGRAATVVGVVANLKYSKLDAEPGPEIYRSFPQNLGPGRVTVTVAIRMPGDPLGIASAARKLVSGIDPAQPVHDIETLQQALSGSIAPRRFNLFLLGTFAAAAMLMALVGIYGVIAYSVTQRTREIGIRMALGSPRGAVVRMVAGQGMGIALSGIGVGLAAAFGLTRWMAALLYDVKPDDPSTFAVVAVALAATALLASLGPALRAARVDPLIALRCE
jgi:putative ABC transport system permease protein